MQVAPWEAVGPVQPVKTTVPEPNGPSASEAGPQPLDYPLVLVEWHDAWFDLDPPTTDERRSDYLVRTVGFLVGENPRFLSVAQELLPDGEGFRAITHIPVPIIERLVRFDAPDGRIGT